MLLVKRDYHRDQTVAPPGASVVLDPYLLLNKFSNTSTERRSSRWHRVPLSRITEAIQRLHRRKTTESNSETSDAADEQTNVSNDQSNKTSTTRVRHVLASSLAIEERQTLVMAAYGKRRKSTSKPWLVGGDTAQAYSFPFLNIMIHLLQIVYTRMNINKTNARSRKRLNMSKEEVLDQYT